MAIDVIALSYLTYHVIVDITGSGSASYDAKITHPRRDCEILSAAISCHLVNALYSSAIANCARGLRMNINDVEITATLTTVPNIAYESGLRAASRLDIAR